MTMPIAECAWRDQEKDITGPPPAAANPYVACPYSRAADGANKGLIKNVQYVSAG
jgi:hypothetical protein